MELEKMTGDGFVWQRRGVGSLGRLGNTPEHTRKDEEHSGMLEFSLEVLNCGCGGLNSDGFVWFYLPAKAQWSRRWQ